MPESRSDLAEWVDPPSDADEDRARTWVEHHLAGVCAGPVRASVGFRGGQTAAEQALATFDVRGYADRRNEVWPPDRRGASRLSPYIRHGLLSLPRVWQAIGEGPAADVRKFRDELLWQEYARHLRARVGAAIARPLRAKMPTDDPGVRPWDRRMACVRTALDELERDGWLTNQARMWLASDWAVRARRDWREGERAMFSQLIDGAAAANGLGWQWVAGTATGRPYTWSRRNVERRAPGLCATCELVTRCPIQRRVDPPKPQALPEPEGLRFDVSPELTAGPTAVERTAMPEAVWLTAESLGDADPALAAHPELPALIVFDMPLLARWRLAGPRLVFLAETLGDLATRREVRVALSRPATVLAGTRLAATFTPVPGWRRRRAVLDVVETHPWPWLRRPVGGSARSFSAWRSSQGRSAG